jgi:predicted RNA-binding protein YlxR (DUF448 family)
MPPSSSRKEPIRTCIACMKRDRKSAMIRLALICDNLMFDDTAKAPGRGGYLHLSRECLVKFGSCRVREYRSLKRTINKQEKLAIINSLRMRLDSSMPVA